MKKSILSASIAAMIGGIGLAGVANAAVIFNTTTPTFQVGVNGGAAAVDRAGATVAAAAAAAAAGTAATQLALSANDAGHMLLVPYFTTNGTNASLLNITNTDQTNGKVLKVRYRGASNSDDLFDFMLLMSPGDVWAANVSRGADGISRLTTTDTSCTIPNIPAAGQPFGTSRLNPALTGDALNAETREGYIEVLVMADIPPAGNLNQGATAPAENPLFTAVKHVNGTPPCKAATPTAATNAAMGALNTDIVNAAGESLYLDLRAVGAVAAGAGRVNTATAQGKGLDFPTGGLMANWIIIDTVKTATFSGSATALVATTAAGAAAPGNITFFPQLNIPYNINNVVATADPFTADPLLQTTGTTIVRSNPVDGSRIQGSGAPFILPQFSDLPDLSTPYVANNTTAQNPRTVAHNVTQLLASTSTVNEYLTSTSIGATTDWVFSMPTRRYSVAMNYGHTGAGDGRVRTLIVNGANGFIDEFFPTTVTNLNNGRICSLADIVGGLVHWDREETSVAVVPGFSPGTFTRVRFCGEAAVLGINNGTSTTSGSLSSSLAYQGVTLNFNEGWARILHNGAPAANAGTAPLGAVANPFAAYVNTGNKGYPAMGAAFIKSSAFGAMWPHRSGL